MLFQHRSYKKEFLDFDGIQPADLNRNLVELDIINKHLGGYKASKAGLRSILKKQKSVRTILDIGFGGGDSIKQLSQFATGQSQAIFFYGVDLKQDCVNYAEVNLTGIENKKLICDDYRNISPELLRDTDLIHCSLFLHHLKEDEIVNLFKFCRTHNCSILANDLHRHWLAYYSIKLLTALFSRSYLVKNDAPLSVKRGFKKKELLVLLQQSGYRHFSVTWSWAFRYIILASE